MIRDFLTTYEKGDLMELKERIEKVLSEILSDKYECKITLRFVPKDSKQAAGAAGQEGRENLECSA